MIKKLFLNSAIYGLAPQIVKLVNVLILPFITPFLSAEDYGVYGLVVSIVGAISVFANLGMNIALSNSITKSPNQYKWLWRQIYGFLNLWSFAYSAILGFIVYFLIPDFAIHNALWIILLNVLPVVLFGPSMTLGSMYYQLRQKPVQIALRTILIGIITAGLTVYFIRYMKLGYMGWFISSAISQFLYQFSYYIPVNFKLGLKPIYNFKRRTIKKLILLCLPILPHYYSNYILDSFDRIIMKLVGVPIGDIGKYNASYSVGNLYGSATYAANVAISPMLLQCFKKNDIATEYRLNKTIIIFFLTVTTVTALFTKEFIPFLIKSEDLKNIYPIAIIIIMSYNYRPMYVASNQKLFYLEKTKALLKVTVIAAGLSLLLNFATIPFGGVMAAAIVTFICFMYVAYSGFYIKEYKLTKRPNYHPIFWLTLTSLLTIFVYFAVEWNIYVKAIIALIISFIGFIGILKTNNKL